jgi:hypothetical protein
MEEFLAPAFDNPLFVTIIVGLVIRWLAVLGIALVVGFRFPHVIGVCLGFVVLCVLVCLSHLLMLIELDAIGVMPLWMLFASSILSVFSLTYLVLVVLIIVLRRGSEGISNSADERIRVEPLISDTAGREGK